MNEITRELWTPRPEESAFMIGDEAQTHDQIIELLKAEACGILRGILDARRARMVV